MPDIPDFDEWVKSPPRPRSRVRGAEKLSGVQPDLLTHWDNLQTEFEREGVKPVLRSGFRTAEQQNALHRAGKPTKGNDGYVNISPHQEGRALDIGNLGSRGQRIVRDYAKRSGLHVPSDEPWHIAIPKQKATQEPTNVPAFDEWLQGQTPPPTQTPKQAPQGAAIEPAISPALATSVPVSTGRFGTPRDKRFSRPLRPKRSLAEMATGGAGVVQPPGIGELRQLDDPVAQQITRIQRQVSAEQSAGERELRRAPGSATARLFDPKLNEHEEVLRRLGEEKDAAKREADAVVETKRLMAQFTRGDKAEIADFVEHLKGKGSTYTGIRTGARSVGASGLYKLAGLTDIANAVQKPLTGQDSWIPDFLKRKALAGELSIEDIPVEQRGQVAEFLTQIGFGLAEIVAAPGGPVGKFAGLAGTESIGRGQSAKEIAKETVKGATVGGVFKAAPMLNAPARTVRGRAANLAKEGAAIGAGTYSVERGFGTPTEDAVLSAATNVALHGVLGARRLRGRKPAAISPEKESASEPAEISVKPAEVRQQEGAQPAQAKTTPIPPETLRVEPGNMGEAGKDLATPRTELERQVVESTERPILFKDANENDIVFEKNDSRISVNNPAKANYLTLWTKQEVNGKEYWRKSGTMETHEVEKTIGSKRGKYLTVDSVEIEKAERGKGLGKELYRQLLKYADPEIEGIISYTPNRVNKREVPSIYKRLGGVQEGDYQVIRRPKPETTSVEQGVGKNLAVSEDLSRTSTVEPEAKVDRPAIAGEEPKRMNFTQFAKSIGAPSDYDVLEHGRLGPSGRMSERSRKQEGERHLERQAANTEAHRAFEDAIRRGEIVDAEELKSRRVTKERLDEGERAAKEKEIRGQIANIDSQIQTIKNLGPMSHLPNGKLKAKYQRTVDVYNEKKAKLLAEASARATYPSAQVARQASDAETKIGRETAGETAQPSTSDVFQSPNLGTRARSEPKVSEQPIKEVTGQGKVIELDAPVPDDVLRIVNRTFNKMVGPDIYSELPKNPKTQDVIELLANVGLSDQIMQESVPALRRAGYSRIGDVLITEEGLRFAPKELAAAPEVPTVQTPPKEVIPNAATGQLSEPTTSVEKRGRLGAGQGVPARETAPAPTTTSAAPSGIARVRMAELSLDPDRFQFRIEKNEKGGSGSLAGVKQWNPDLEGVISVWRDPADGKTYIVNGHNRFEKAQELGVRSLTVRYVDAKNAVEARALGAKINIAEGHGTALDAAQYFKDTGDTEANLRAEGIPIERAMVKDGLALAKLDDFIFNAVKRGELPQEHGVAIGSKIENPDLQAQAYKAISKAAEKGKTLNKGVVDEMLDAIGAAPRQTETEQSLFGDFETERSLFNERAQVAAAIKRQLAGDKTLFETAARRSGRLAEGGTKVDVEQAKQLQESASEALGVFDTLKNRTGGISDILDSGAKQVAAGKRPDAVAKETYGKIKQAVNEAIRGRAPEAVERGAEPRKRAEGESRQRSLGEDAETQAERKSQAGFLNLGRTRHVRATTPVLQEVELATQGSLQRSRRSPKGLLTRAQTAFTSQFTPLRVLEQTLYGKAKIPGIDLARKFEQVAGAPGKAEADVIEFRQRVVDPIRQHADDFNSYLFLKRTIDRLSKEPERKQVAEWTAEKAEQGLEELRGKVGPDVMAKLERAGEVYQVEMRKALRLQVESGRMTEDLYQKILDSNDFYAPFKMLKYIEQSEGIPGSGRHIATVQDLTKAITGIHSEDFRLGNFLQVSAEQIVRSRILAEKNLKMLELDRLADLDPTGDLIARVKPESAPKPHYERVRYFKDGKVQLLEVQKPVAEAVQGLNEVQTGLVTKVLMVGRRPLQVGATSANAAFQVVNSFADTARSALMSRYGVRSPVDAVRFPMDWTYALYSSLKGNFGKPNDLYMDFLKSGAANSTIQRELTPSSFKPTLGLAQGPRHLAKSIIDTVPKLSNAIEESAKLLGLKRGLRSENIASLEGEARKEAMERLVTEVRNYSGSPDFARRGSEMRQLNLLVMFLNARVQGTVSDVARLAGRTGAKDAAIAWGRMATVVGLPTTALALLNFSDEYREDYHKIPEWERSNYWMIPRNSFFVNEDTEEKVRDYWRIPKRNIFQPFANTIEAGIEFAQSREPEAVSKWTGKFLEEMSPINIGGDTPVQRLESTVGSLNPAIKVPVEVATGRDTFRHQDIIPQYMKKAAPEEQYRASTPEGFVRAGKALGVSPLTLEHATRGASAELFSQFSVRQPQPGRSAVGQYPIGRRFVRSGQVADDAGRGERVKEAEQKESGEQVARRRNAMSALSSWRGLSESKIDSKVAEVEKTDPKLAEKIEQLRAERKKGLTYADKLIAALGIENGARKEFIQSELSRMKTQAERDAFLEDLKRKGLLPKNERPSRPSRPSRPRRPTRAEMRQQVNP